MSKAHTAIVSRSARFWFRVFAVLTYGFLYFPIVVLVVFSFSESKLLVFPIVSFSFKWYGALVSNTDLLHSLQNSFIVAGSVVPLTLLVGTPLAFALDRFEFLGKNLLERGILIPLIIPGLITGLSILLLLTELEIRLSLITVIIGHSIWCMPIVVTQVYARLRRLDQTIEEASMDLGANRWQTFFRVTLPNIRTSLIGSALLVFTLSFDEVPVTFLLTGTENTLPMHIWSMLREGVTPEINAIATITVAVSIAMIAIGLRLLNRDENIRGQTPDKGE